MMKLKQFFAGVLLLLIAVFPHAVSAEDFNFMVAANFSNLHPDVKTVKIACTAKEGNSMIGVGVQNISVPPSRTINDSYQIKFNAIVNGGESHPERADNYICNFFLYSDADYGEPLPASSGLCNDANNEWICAKSGTTLVKELTGTISQAPSTSIPGFKPRKGSINLDRVGNPDMVKSKGDSTSRTGSVKPKSGGSLAPRLNKK